MQTDQLISLTETQAVVSEDYVPVVSDGEMAAAQRGGVKQDGRLPLVIDGSILASC